MYNTIKLSLLVGSIIAFCFILPLYIGVGCDSKPVSPVAPPMASFEVFPDSGKAPLRVNLVDKSTGKIESWLWNFGDGSISMEANPQKVYSSAGTYNIKLVVSSSAGTDSIIRTNCVTVVNPTLMADFVSDVQDITAPQSVQFTNTSTGQYSSNYWEFGDGTVSTEINPKHTYSKPGKYTIILTIKNDEYNISDRKSVSSYITASPEIKVKTVNIRECGPVCCFTQTSGTAFEHHTPIITCQVQLSTYASNSRIQGYFYIHAKEAPGGQNDWGQGEKWYYDLATADAGFKIVEIQPRNASWTYQDTDKTRDYQSTDLGIFNVLGETENEDLFYQGLDCGEQYDRTQFKFAFHPVKLIQERIY